MGSIQSHGISIWTVLIPHYSMIMAHLEGEEVAVSPIHFKPFAVVPRHIDHKYLLDRTQGLDHSSG